MDQVEPRVDHVPSVSYLRVLGSKAYVYILVQDRVLSEKTAPRAEIGILIGFEGNHIYRVYLPHRVGNKIVRSSSVRFDEAAPQSTFTLPLQGPYLSDVHPPKSSVLNNRGKRETLVLVENKTLKDANSDSIPSQELDNSHNSHNSQVPHLDDHSIEMPKPNDPFFLPSESEPEHEVELSDTGTEAQEESTTAKNTVGGRQKGVRNKTYTPQPQFNRVTRS